ncbi:RING-box protein 2 isoform X2 [Chiloscyllium punctatum]|uniref:RING-box protein 2 isoform X2 n=1 Tax=Chiloscyllium punctatum TaxID=137246 RepID=UPI003B63AA23
MGGAGAGAVMADDDLEDSSVVHNVAAGAGAGGGGGGGRSGDKMFTLKKWNAVAMWSWDVECDTCAICRVQMPAFGAKLKINKKTVLWFGENATTPSITAVCHCG